MYLVLFDGDIDHLNDLALMRRNCMYPVRAGSLKVAIAHMKHWDSSIGKNTAHAFALCSLDWAPTRADVLVNLDADNVMHDDFLTRVSGHAQWPGEDTGVTGRVFIFANVFSTTNGYD